MSTATPIAPYRRIQLRDGTSVPFYLLRFDKLGACESPQTRAHALAELRSGDYTDVVVCSHGWNNSYATATARYDDFVDGFTQLARERAAAVLTRPFRPLLLGIIWPSTLFLLPSEAPPLIAALGGEPAGATPGDDAGDIEEIAQALPDDVVERFRALAQAGDGLGDRDARELAAILAPLHAGTDDERAEAAVDPTPDELLTVWRRLPAARPRRAAADADEWGTVGADDGGDGPAAAGLGFLDPRGMLRATTVRMMKDRAGVVGGHGVAALVGDVLRAGDARLHLVGHSYGARVCLSAVAAADLPRQVDSVLLLQPAINHWCFADRVDGRDRRGGYRGVLDAVEQPILSTFSRHDEPLTKFFHLALTRDADLGEPQIAAWPEPPSPYAALGGYGPRGAPGTRIVELQDPGSPYPLDAPGVEILAIDASRGVSGHSDISNPFTWWALLAQVAGP
jgi:hypothetical protein